ncbi:N-formylglutamate amidohydrolase [Candidatus Gracilibacteria bacterium]|nr:N-formylglutamate amidohydrolase [Candidatus Gracilibacteria bacterium]MCF7819300.1 N-formylglutamate amidohydrolase [Candidatus Gracilibacteria bacterium]
MKALKTARNVILNLGKRIKPQQIFSATRNFFRKFFPPLTSLPENVLVAASHGSARFPLKLFRYLSLYYQISPRLLLNFSDYGTKSLLEGIPDPQKAIPRYGRIVGDPNRDLKQDDLIRFEDFGGNKIFREKFERRLTTSWIRFIWRRKLLNYSYRPYYRDVHKKIEAISEKMEDKRNPIIFVDVHDIGNRILGQRSKDDIQRKTKIPKVIISNAPDEETEEGVLGTAPEYFVKEFAETLAENLEISPQEVKINHLYKGGNIIRYFGNLHRNPRLKRVLKEQKIFAIQIEFNRSWYLDEKTQRIYKQQMRFVRNGLIRTLKHVSKMNFWGSEENEEEEREGKESAKEE